jgi:hypothetical protein
MKLDKKVLKALILESLNESGHGSKGQGGIESIKSRIAALEKTEGAEETIKILRKRLAKLESEKLQKEADLKSIPGGGEGSGIATGMLEAVDSFKKTLEDNAKKLEEMRIQNEELMKGFSEVRDTLRAEIERITQEEYAKHNRPLPSDGPSEEEIDIPD